MNEPKFLILTTNRTEDGAPVYAPCGDVRELLAAWQAEADMLTLEGQSSEEHSRDASLLADCADELEAALKPNGDLLVARPLQIGVEYPATESNNHNHVQRAITGED